MNDRKRDSQEALKAITRRHFFRQSAYGVGSLALASLLNETLFAAAAQAADSGPAARARDPLAPRAPHFQAKARNIIFLIMAGAPSQFDLLDPKPKLNQYNGQKIPEEIVKGERFAFIKGVPKLLGSPHSFRRYGQSGIEVSNQLPYLSRIVDDLCVVR